MSVQPVAGAPPPQGPGEQRAYPEFAEALSRRPLTTEYTDRLATHLPESWTTHRDGVWVHAHRRPDTEPAAARTQGFKIHVSAAPHCVATIMDLTVPICTEYAVPFKIIGDPALHAMLDSKRQPRGYSGKFMTIYPPDDATFVDLIEGVHQSTHDSGVVGPRVLSDRQYKDNPVLYYRYGGFHPPRRVKIDGTHATYLISPSGNFIGDERLPYFQLPAWVGDPFGTRSPTAEPDGILLGDRYLVRDAVRFSNCGGLYRATDTNMGETVFIKEGRPFTNCWANGIDSWDAVYFLRREYETIQRLQDLDFIPAPLDLLKESDHLFLVEEHLAAMDMRKYWAREDVILAPYIRRPGRIEAWTAKFETIAAHLISMVRAVHDKGVLLGDLSPDNVLIDPDSMRMWLIDFESATTATDPPEIRRRATMWATPGFASPQRTERDMLVPADDFYAAGMVLYYGLTAATSLTELDPTSTGRFLNEFVQLGLPTRVAGTITSLLEGDADKALAWLDGRSGSAAGPTQCLSNEPRPREPLADTKLGYEIAEMLRHTAEFVLHTADYTRSDRLWPAEPTVFDTNPLSVAHGACGPALLLANPDTPAELPDRALTWILDRPLSVDAYPPGLYLGLAGIACTLLHLGAPERATVVMDMARRSPLLFDEPGMLLGIAGWGYAALHMYNTTRDTVWLDWAVQGAEHLLRTANHNNATCHWIRNADNRIHYGFGHGASGVALFLITLHETTGIESYRDVAARALDFDLSHGIESDLGRSWPRFEGDTLGMPYMVHGGAGIGSAAIRYYAATKEPTFLAAAKRIADDCNVKYSATPGLFEGLAGIGEFMLDMHTATGDEVYYHRALDIAESIMWFRIPKPDGAAWPGRWLNNVSHDYAAGAAGVGLFFARLRGSQRRLFLDFAP